MIWLELSTDYFCGETVMAQWLAGGMPFATVAWGHGETEKPDTARTTPKRGLIINMDISSPGPWTYELKILDLRRSGLDIRKPKDISSAFCVATTWYGNILYKLGVTAVDPNEWKTLTNFSLDRIHSQQFIDSKIVAVNNTWHFRYASTSTKYSQKPVDLAQRALSYNSGNRGSNMSRRMGYSKFHSISFAVHCGGLTRSWLSK